MILDMFRYMLVGLSTLVAFFVVVMLVIAFPIFFGIIFACAMIYFLGWAACVGYDQVKDINNDSIR